MKYGSVCSGVEAATAAWHPLGWKPQWFSEIEKFPSAVLAHHYPDVPNLGDMTQFKEWPIDRSIDILVGGTPCQSFSVAGLRKGLDDPRGNLMLTYLAIAAQYQPKWLVWENVPGVLSSQRGRDFGTFLGALGQLGYGFAYRVLDAQYFGVAQRRRRVFVVGYLGDWRRSAAVLFERESLSGHPAPSREAGQKAAPTVTQGAPFSRTGNQRVEAEAIVAKCLTARGAGAGNCDPETSNMIPIAFGAQNSANQGDSVSTEVTPTLDKSKTPAVAIQNATRGASQNGLGITTDGPMYTLDVGSQHAVAYDTTNITSPTNGSNPKPGDPVFTLASGQHPPLLTPQVRRLTPTECERLQGFPDNFTQIPWRNKPAEDCPDGPRYKAMGNSMAVPVMRWIGERIQMVESLDD
jgi:DNA (cytosine-5)-methyltransferase 1